MSYITLNFFSQKHEDLSNPLVMVLENGDIIYMSFIYMSW